MLALGDGDEEGSVPSSTVAGATPTDPFFEFLAPPSDVAVVALGDDIVTSTASPAELESDGPTLCVTLRSIGAAGRGSPDFGPVCSN